MTDQNFFLSREQRDEIMKATAAIGRQVKEMLGKPNTQALIAVVGTNLAIIQTNLSNLPKADSN